MQRCEKPRFDRTLPSPASFCHPRLVTPFSCRLFVSAIRDPAPGPHVVDPRAHILVRCGFDSGSGVSVRGVDTAGTRPWPFAPSWQELSHEGMSRSVVAALRYLGCHLVRCLHDRGRAPTSYLGVRMLSWWVSLVICGVVFPRGVCASAVPFSPRPHTNSVVSVPPLRPARYAVPA